MVVVLVVVPEALVITIQEFVEAVRPCSLIRSRSKGRGKLRALPPHQLPTTEVADIDEVVWRWWVMEERMNIESNH